MTKPKLRDVPSDEYDPEHEFDLWRSGFVNRWHTFTDPRLRNGGDTVASHSWRVAVLVSRLCPQIEPGDVLVLLLQAIYHDADELMTGDLSYGFKRENEAIAKAVSAAGRRWIHERHVPMPEKLHPLIKLCDMMDHYMLTATLAPDLLTDPRWVEHYATVRQMARDLHLHDKVNGIMYRAVAGCKY